MFINYYFLENKIEKYIFASNKIDKNNNILFFKRKWIITRNKCSH